MKKIFFIGINGIGMSALAKIMIKKGYEIFGSDIRRKEMTEELEKMGAQIEIGHSDLSVENMDLVVYSSAIKKNNPEYVTSKLNKIPLIRRGELLAQLLNEETGIAVAGTHGKTTTSSMLSVASLDLDATIVVGGIIPEIASNAKVGNGDLFIAEADESDNSFLYMKPKYSIITNIEADHLENHGTYENLKASFRQFIDQTEKEVIVNYDCCELYKMYGEAQGKLVKTYSIESDKADIYAKNIKTNGENSSYEVYIDRKKAGDFKLTIPGRHNISNSLGVIYLSLKFGVELEILKKNLENFKGAKRRFDVLYKNCITLVDDYAHHPTEIKATLEAAKQRSSKRIIAVFQPHRYSRTNFLLENFTGAFDQADKVILLPIYSAGEKETYNINLEKLAEKIAYKEKIEFLSKQEELVEEVKNKSQAGDLFIFMGAGDISQMAYGVKAELER